MYEELKPKKKTSKVILWTVLALLVVGTIGVSVLFTYGDRFVGTLTDRGPFADGDKDGIMNADERDISFTDPFVADTDGDGLNDGDEFYTHKTNPLLKDTDNDGLNDGDELKRGTDPFMRDTDGDGVIDGKEVAMRTDPKDKGNVTAGLEGLAGKDSDGDKVNDLDEYNYGTAANNADTDGDNISDYVEIFETWSNPLDKANIIVPKFTNIQDGSVLTDAQPFLEGIAPINAPVFLYLTNEFGFVVDLGQTTTSPDVKPMVNATYGYFMYKVQKPLLEGEFMLFYRTFVDGKVVSAPLTRVKLELPK